MTSSEHPGSHISGVLRSEDGAGVVRIEERYDTDIDDLWEALTDPERLRRWYGVVDGNLCQGGEFRTFIADADLESTGRVQECEPARRLLVTIKETEESYGRGQGTPPHDATIEATLASDEDQTILTLEVRGLPVDKIAFYGAGWQIHTETLAHHVSGGEGNDRQARWGELVPSYQQLAAGLN